MKRMKKCIEKYLKRAPQMFVIADPADNSITISASVLRHMQEHSKGVEPRVFVFKIPKRGTYGFTLHHGLDNDAKVPLCDIQRNEQHQCVGFETLYPSVTQILYDYKCEGMEAVRLAVTVHKLAKGKVYYQLDNPNE